MNRFALSSSSAALTLAIAVALGAAPQAAHANYKTSTGSACLAYGNSTTPDELLYLVNGIRPRYDTDEYILCNFVVDSENGWYNAANSATLSMYFKAGNIDAPVTCTATAGSAYMYGVLTYSAAQTIPATLSSTLTMSGMTSPGSYSWAPFNVNCKLPAKATLARMVLNELGPV
ncbi:MAG: hypothetical protein HOP03_04505 [Lysobacter sp.]|nr:hypothetical protein [Lysobacter sp.]